MTAIDVPGPPGVAAPDTAPDDTGPDVTAPDADSARAAWLAEVLRVPGGHPLRDMSRIPAVGLDLPDGWGALCEQLAEPGTVTLRTVEAPVAPQFRARRSGGAPDGDDGPRDRLDALLRGASASARRIDGPGLVLTLGALSDTGGAPAWSVAAGGARVGRAPVLLVPVLLARGDDRDEWRLDVDPDRPAWTNLAAARALADEHPEVALALMRNPVVPVSHLQTVLDSVARALADGRRAGESGDQRRSGEGGVPTLELLTTADLALLPLGALHAAEQLRLADTVPVSTGPPGAGSDTTVPGPARQPDGIVVEVMAAPAGPAGDAAVAELVTTALAGGSRVAVVALVDDDLRPTATRLTAAGLGSFVLDLTGPCATRDGLASQLQASGHPTAPPILAAAQVAQERSDLVGRLAADTALAHRPGPAGVSWWQAWSRIVRLEAELPPEVVVAAREVRLPAEVATTPRARAAIVEAAADVAEALRGGPAGHGDGDPWPVDGIDRWTAEAGQRVTGAVERLGEAEAALRGPVRALVAPAATSDELALVVRWLRAARFAEPVPLGQAADLCGAQWRARAARVRHGVEDLEALMKGAGLRASALDVDPAPLLAELDETPERGWLARATGRSAASVQENRVAKRIAAHGGPRLRLDADGLRAVLRAVADARLAAGELRDLLVSLLPDPAPWNPADRDDAERVVATLDLWQATADVAEVPGVTSAALEAAAGTARVAGKPGLAPIDAVEALAGGAVALASALGVASDDVQWLGGRALLAALELDGDRWRADVAEGLPALRRRVALRTGLATLERSGASDLAALVGAGPARASLPLVGPDHLVGLAELAVLGRIEDERRGALGADPGRLSSAERADVVRRAAGLESAHRGAARDVVPHRLLGHVPGGPGDRAALAQGLVDDLADRPLPAFMADECEAIGALVPAVLLSVDLVARAMAEIPDGGLLVVDDAGQVPAGPLAAAVARARHVVLVDRTGGLADRTGGCPAAPGSALAALGGGAPAAGVGRDRHPELRVRPTDAAWERHVSSVVAAASAAGLTVTEAAGPQGRVADLAVAVPGRAPVAVLLSPPDPARPEAAAVRPTTLAEVASPSEVALSAWLDGHPGVAGSWAAVRSVSLAAWAVDPAEVVAELVRTARAG